MNADTDADTADGTPTAPRAASDGVLEEALERLHVTGPERFGRLSNHAPMVVESLASHGQSSAVHHWLDLYAEKLEDFPAPVAPVTDANWPTALGDMSRAADWISYFTRAIDQEPWQDVLSRWWPRLLPGVYGGATHPLIRVGHAVRALTGGTGGAPGLVGVVGAGGSAPRLAELAHGLGYWAARHHTVSGVGPLTEAVRADDALDAVPPISELTGSFPARLALVRHLPVWAADVNDPDAAKASLADLVRAATHRYATHGHGDQTMLVHAATAPNAVLRTLPALPRELWAPSLQVAWTASAAVTAMYAPREPVPYAPPGRISFEEVLELALAHGDEHVIKLADTARDVGDERALAAALRAIELSEPLDA